MFPGYFHIFHINLKELENFKIFQTNGDMRGKEDNLDRKKYKHAKEEGKERKGDSLSMM